MRLHNLTLALVTVFVLNTVAAEQASQRNNGTGTSTIPVVLASFASTAQSSEDSPEAYLDAHNTYRAKVGVKPMNWDRLLMAHAAIYASERIEDCNCYHSDGSSYGSNMANSSGSISGREAVMRWVDERFNYDLESNTCAEGESCGNYTQVIWGNSISLGCVKINCTSGGTFVICNYDPPGNQLHQRPVNQSTPGAPPPSTPAAPPPSTSSSPPPSITPRAEPLPANSSADTPMISPPTNASQPPPVAPPPNSTVAEPPIVGPVKQRNKRKGILVGSIVAVCLLFLGLGFILFFFWRKGTGSALNELALNVSLGDEFGNGMGPREFTYIELSKATKNFAEEEKLGEGGFGSVYKGFLRDSNTDVAVKRISRRSKQGIKEYISEVKIFSRLRHRNLVKFIGWCHEKELLLVYEFMPNGSLDSHLFKGRSQLPWNLRFKIAQGLASALLYLHESGDFCVLHRDIKTNNIMLDSAFNAKLGDFGLARLADHEKGSLTTLLAGTMGYLAPECHRTGKASKESDIYSFGVVVLEIVCGRRSIEPRYDEDQASLVAWVWQAYGNHRLLDVVDMKLSTDFDMREMECLLIIGLWCAHPIRNMRPSIKQAMQVLNFEAALPNLPNEMPTPVYNIPNAPIIRTSEPCLSNMSITVPR
ncbi:hypothetical protein SLA2020_211170 [Shorea laevis]